MQQNCKCWLCGDRDETINLKISEYSKLEQKVSKTRHDSVGKVIHWELCKKLKFDQSTKWYMHKPESVLENVMHEILWNLEIPTDYLVATRRSDLMIINKKKKKRTCHIVDVTIPVDHRVKIKENEKIGEYLDLAREMRKLRNMRVTVIPIVISALGMAPKGLVRGLEVLEIGGLMETIKTTALLRYIDNVGCIFIWDKEHQRLISSNNIVMVTNID